MSGFLFHYLRYLTAVLMACPAPCCAQFSPERSERTAHDACCQAQHDVPSDRPAEPATPVDDCCCQADLTLSSNWVKVAAGDVAWMAGFLVEPEQTVATVGLTGRQSAHTGPPLRVLQCVWRN